VSWRIISIDEFESITPVKPPMVNKKINPIAHHKEELLLIFVPWRVVIHLKILIPVGIAIIIVAEVKYARVSTSKPIVNIW
jgi:hypothetical protein